MIRHAFSATAAAIPLLTVAMIQPPLNALLMTAIGRALLPAPRMAAARLTAVLLPAIAAHADPEHRPAIRVAAKTLPENNFSMNRHPRLRAAFDNGNRSCQGKTNSEVAFFLA